MKRNEMYKILNIGINIWHVAKFKLYVVTMQKQYTIYTALHKKLNILAKKSGHRTLSITYIDVPFQRKMLEEWLSLVKHIAQRAWKDLQKVHTWSSAKQKMA